MKNTLYKVRFTLSFLICLGLYSTTGNQFDLAKNYFKHALDKVNLNLQCLRDSAPRTLIENIVLDKQEERNKQATLDKLEDNNLRILLGKTIGVAERKMQQEEDLRA